MITSRRHASGFSLIELMIVITIIAVLLSVALPAYQDYTIRARAAEALSVGAAAKLAVAETCQADASALVQSNADAGYGFAPSNYVQNVQVRADCSTMTMQIVIQTRNTGANFDPIIVLLTRGLLFLPVSLNYGGGSLSWHCLGLAETEAYLPAGCRLSRFEFNEPSSPVI